MTESGSLEQFLDAIAQDRDDKTRHLATEFYDSIHSGRFRWIGLGEVEDELGRPNLTLYVAERPEDQVRNNITDPFTELSLKLRPDTFLHLYFIPNNQIDLGQNLVIEDMKARYGSANYQPNPRLLFEETIIPPVFYQNL